MKNGTLYAAKLKKMYPKLRSAAGDLCAPNLDDPIRCLAVATLGVGCSDQDAERGIDRALVSMVDWNEMRVSSAFELNKAIGNAIPRGTERCHHLIRVFQAIFDRENKLSLDRLKNMGRREARHYLESLDGIDSYAVASVILWSLGGHSIPVNDRLLSALRDADLVNPSAEREEVQSFLERHVSAADAKTFCMIMQDFASTQRGSSHRSSTRTSPRRKSRSKSA